MGVGVLKGAATSAGDVRPQRRGLVAKRVLDIVVSVLILVALAPVLLLVALAILIADGRPILFRQRRVGRYGELFTIYKFRTMVPDAHERLDEVAHANERGGPLFKASADPRVTRIGKVLRRTSLDELPQFFNVLNGSMSLVGPRPSLPEERAAFPLELLEREDLPQGLTGLWQLDGRHDHDFAVYRDLDLDYIRTWSFRRDLWILVRTPFVVAVHAVRGEGAPAGGAGEPTDTATAGAAGDAVRHERPAGASAIEPSPWDRGGHRRLAPTALAASAVGTDD